jgi:hypothetical protein
MKFQIPNLKFQINSKSQIPNAKFQGNPKCQTYLFGAWNLELGIFSLYSIMKN